MAGADVPPPDYFAGLYERVGRSGGGVEAALIDDLVRLAPDPAGGGLLMSVCLPDGAPGRAPLRLAFETFAEVPNLLFAQGEGAALFCQFFNDAGNYPILACQTEDGAATPSGPRRIAATAREPGRSSSLTAFLSACPKTRRSGEGRKGVGTDRPMPAPMAPHLKPDGFLRGELPAARGATGR